MTARDLKDYRLRSGLTLRDVAAYCNISYQLIGNIELGKEKLTDNCFSQIVKGINGAKNAKANKTFSLNNKKEAEAPASVETNKSDAGATTSKLKPKTKINKTKKGGN